MHNITSTLEKEGKKITQERTSFSRATVSSMSNTSASAGMS
jgi:hypothetical protein